MNKLLKAALSVSAATIVATASLAPVMVNAWGDNTTSGRASYTNEQIEGGALGDTITFNSISNGAIGDEKNFVGARLASSNGAFEPNELKVEIGETYTIRLYVHNNSPKGTDAVAKDVQAYFESASLSSKEIVKAKSHTIVGYLSSSNANPTLYWDEIKLTADEDVYLEYVKDSAKFANDKLGEVKLSNDAIVTGGKMTLGYDSLNGEIPGCYDFTGVVSFDVKIQSAAAAKVSKQVRIKGDSDKSWKESVNAKVGDEVEFQIEYVNLLSETVKNVAVRDVLPNNIEFVDGSAVLYNGSNPNGLQLEGDYLVKNGVVIGDYGTNGNAYIRFTGKVVDKTMACGNNQLVNWASATVSGSKIKNAVYKDDASVMVKKDDESCKDKPTPTPVPDNPGGTPETIVSTGPETIVTGAIGAGSVVTVLGYYIASRKKLM